VDSTTSARRHLPPRRQQQYLCHLDQRGRRRCKIPGPGLDLIIISGAVDVPSARLERSKAFRTGLNRVHGKDHPHSTVVALEAKYPDRFCVVHANGVRGELRGIGRDGHEARMEANLVVRGSVCDRSARRGEGRLRHGVVLLVELKGDGVTRLRSNVRRPEGQDGRIVWAAN